MKFFRCQCGQRTSISSMGPGPSCYGCEECNTTLSDYPDGHEPLAPHEYATKPAEADQPGATLTRCRRCLRRPVAT